MQQRNVVRNKWFYAAQLVFDILIVVAAYVAGLYLQRPELFESEALGELLRLLSYISVLSLIIFVVFKPYRCGIVDYAQTLFNLFFSILFISLAIVIFEFAVKGIGVWRKTFFYAYCFQIPVFVLYKFIIFKLHSKIIKPKKSIIISNTLENAAGLAIKIINTQSSLFEVSCLATQNYSSIYKKVLASNQVFLSSNCSEEAISSFVEFCAVNDIDCCIVPNFKDIVINSGDLNFINDLLVFNMDTKMDFESRIVKRFIDIVVSLLGSIVSFPIVLIAGIAIFLQDGGNPFYRQIRLTKNNKEFKIYKLRTMIKNAEAETGAVLAQKSDGRITKLGKFLRAFRIDEIPQLYNVLKGEMSFVGPRPERPELVKDIVTTVPEFKYRTIVKAGVTGLAQTMGRYDTDFKDKVMLDLYYISNFSIILDIKIIFLTLRTLTQPSVTTGVSKPKNISNVEYLNKLGYEVECFEENAKTELAGNA